jgi:pimeloyl-ACP methyl ester carboxylesterase
VRTYARTYPDEVAGIVLVDSSHEDMQILMNNKPTLLRSLSRGREIPPVQETMAPAVSGSAEESGGASGQEAKVSPPYDKLPPEAQEIRLWAISQPKYNEARRSEFDSLAEELVRMHDQRAEQEYPLGDRPLIVLTRGKNLSEGHRNLQADLVGLSRNSKQVVAENSGHHIHLDDPEAVAEAVRRVIHAVRQRDMLN